jgi:hypothetical protein
MIVDCDAHHITEKESLYYISKQFGRRISRRTYYKRYYMQYQITRYYIILIYPMILLVNDNFNRSKEFLLREVLSL